MTIEAENKTYNEGVELRKIWKKYGGLIVAKNTTGINK